MNAEEREQIVWDVLDYFHATHKDARAWEMDIVQCGAEHALRLAIPDDCVVVKREDVDQLLVAAKIFAGTAEELDSIMDDDVRVRLADAIGDA